MEEKKEKQGLNIELSEEELDQATGGTYNPLDDEGDIIIDTTPYHVK